ncbi:hypothetical protein [Polyangium jinanense]|uniref:Uncharacterized protein n=1 Tax=Polyangium jinanense TaxID=2829994 RepID=A0A9X4ASK2_9BACT|nr:hypothetical protein [Polyangium jinanense]MDC3955850.1 hypothetical protein [Polyangium jinanense]MDC3983209.1 hypothetical protein [Polyangium jinanense]
MSDELESGREMEGEELAFCNASGRLMVKSLDMERSFAEAVDDFRRLEAEFVVRGCDTDFHVLETRRRIAEMILTLAEVKHPPLEVCREAWKDMVRLGFSNREREYTMTWFYAECCRYDETPEEGLALLEPLVAELERGLEEARATQSDTDFFEYHLEPLRKLRDELLAQQRGEQIPGKTTRRIDEARRSTPDDD